MRQGEIKALVFDVFGTVVDWRTGIIHAGEALGRAKGLQVDWVRFADAWRGLYQPTLSKVRDGHMPWTRLDDLHRRSLDTLLGEFGITGLSEEEIDHFNRAWHRLPSWPDSVAGLQRLRTRYILATCSNGNIALMVNLARYGGLPWDAILGAETARGYKPQPQVYLSTVDMLGVEPVECIMVAAHYYDLKAARAAACGPPMSRARPSTGRLTTRSRCRRTTGSTSSPQISAISRRNSAARERVMRAALPNGRGGLYHPRAKRKREARR